MEQEILTGNQVKVNYYDDKRIHNAGTFEIYNQDHTLGNLLKHQLLSDRDNILFCGYMKPHPLEEMIRIKLQTTEEKHPVEILNSNVNKLKNLNNRMREQFDNEMKKIVENNQIIYQKSQLKNTYKINIVFQCKILKKDFKGEIKN